jgi:hypothetical protein
MSFILSFYQLLIIVKTDFYGGKSVQAVQAFSPPSYKASFISAVNALYLVAAAFWTIHCCSPFGGFGASPPLYAIAQTLIR